MSEVDDIRIRWPAASKDWPHGDRSRAEQDIGTLLNCVTALRAEVERLGRDARRYRYLRTELSAVQTFPGEIEVSFMLRKPRGMKFYFNSAGLDDYLDKLESHDAAMENPQ